MDKQVHYLEARDHLNIYSMKNLKALLLRNSFTKVDFIHLPPIQSISGNNSRPLITVKNLWYLFSLALFSTSGSKINLDNLFAVAWKGRK
jgi:hypothetical protein